MPTTQVSVAPATEKFAQLHDVKARYLEAGEGYPTILIHGVGFTSGAEGWLPAIRAGFADKLHVVALDNIGWGKGDRPTFEYSLAYFADFLRELQDVLGFSKTNIIGHSLGGWISAIFAYESPERVNKLVLDSAAGLNATPPATVSQFEPPTEEQVREQTKSSFRDPKDQEEQTAFRWENVNQPDAAEAYRQITKHLSDTTWRSRYHLGRRLSKISVPTLVNWGGIGNPLFPPASGEEMAAAIPGAKLNIIEGCGHFVPMEKPKEWAQVVSEFLLS